MVQVRIAGVMVVAAFAAALTTGAAAQSAGRGGGGRRGRGADPVDRGADQGSEEDRRVLSAVSRRGRRQAVARDPEARHRGALLHRPRHGSRLERHRPRPRHPHRLAHRQVRARGPARPDGAAELPVPRADHQRRRSAGPCATPSRGRCCGASRSPRVSGDRVLVDFTEYLVRDGNDMAGRLRPGSYRFDADAQLDLPADDARASRRTPRWKPS